MSLKISKICVIFVGNYPTRVNCGGIDAYTVFFIFLYISILTAVHTDFFVSFKSQYFMIILSYFQLHFYTASAIKNSYFGCNSLWLLT